MADSQPDPQAPAGTTSDENRVIAAKLREYADLLEQQGADGFREKVYRNAANVVAALDRPVGEILAREGREGLVELPAVGWGIAGAIAEMLVTGRWSQLERLRGELEPEALLQTVPGIGPELARRLADDLHIETLEELEVAAHGGQLSRLPGFGPRREQMIIAALSERLGRRRLRQGRQLAPQPPVDLVLEVDRLYRQRAAEGVLRMIAPKRFNPSGVAWLPVLHLRGGDWHFTVLYSNTALAHRLGKTADWVVICYQAAGQPEGRCTVVTETRGPLSGQRVVRGREDEMVAERNGVAQAY